MEKDGFCFKIIIIGDMSVGKTQILSSYTDKFKEKIKPTVAIDFIQKKIENENEVISFQIWDTAGEERYKSIIRGYYKNSNGAFIVYDITNKKSFENIDNWFDELDKNTEIMLIGNKKDLIERKISYEEGKSKAMKYKIDFYEVSAKTGENINKIFSILFKKVYQKYKENQIDDYIEIEHNKKYVITECC